MEQLLTWFQQILDAAIRIYFQQGGDFASLQEIGEPSGKILEEITGVPEQQISFEEKVVLMLALMPHLCPQALDIFFVNNKNFDRPYSEFGGWIGLSHGGFLPTGETASFILAMVSQSASPE